MIIIRFKARVTKDMAWGEETFTANIKGVLQDDGTLKIDRFDGITPTSEEDERLRQMGSSW